MLPTLLMLVTVTGCLALAAWQLQRAADKRATGDAIAAWWDAAPTPVEGVADWRSLEFRHVTVRGVLEHDRAFHLGDRVRGGRRGIDVITPLRLERGDTRLLVNRGWLAAAAPESGEQPVELTGHIAIVQPPAIRLGPGISPESDAWHADWAWLDLETFRARSGEPALPVVLRLDGGSEAALAANWPKPKSDPGMHIGYAIQWLAFAVIALVLWGRGLIRRPQPAGVSA